MAYGRHFINRFGHNSAANCLISVKFEWGKHFFTEFWQCDRYPSSTERIFVFLMQFGLWWVVSFVRSRIHLLLWYCTVD